jgi:hypothetical protein
MLNNTSEIIKELIVYLALCKKLRISIKHLQNSENILWKGMELSQNIIWSDITPFTGSTRVKASDYVTQL